MGYRSTVRIVTTKEDYETLCRKVDELNTKRGGFKLIGTDKQPEFYEERAGCVVFGWDDVKWYDDYYEDVIEVVKALASLEESSKPYEFCRVGEDVEDVEHKRVNGADALAVHLDPVATIVAY